MDRRSFIKGLALLAAGAAARPERVAAFEHFYTVNAPVGSAPLIAVDEIMLSGNATLPVPVVIDFFRENGDVAHSWGLNTYGGFLRWAAMPDGKILTPSFGWKIRNYEDFAHTRLLGTISYLDQNLKRHTCLIEAIEGTCTSSAWA